MKGKLYMNTNYALLVQSYKSQREAARALGIPESTLRYRLRKERQENPISSAVKPEDFRPKSGKRGFIITAAQNDTDIHHAFWENLVSYADATDRTLIVVPITYAPNGFSQKEKSWATPVVPYLMNQRIILADDLVVCGEMDISPTAVYPLSGLDGYSKAASAIFPHTKVALRSVATPKKEPVKLIMTTGAVTYPNYIPKKTGIKAVFHHVFGAVVVDVDADLGTWWYRHIHAKEDGSFIDLDVEVSGGELHSAERPEAIVLGDVHIEKVDQGALEDTMALIERLRPKCVVLHDLIDFMAKNHHNRNSFAHNFLMEVRGLDDVGLCFRQAADFLNAVAEKVDEVVVVPSNHHDSFRRWLEETNFKDDPRNAEFYLEEMLRYVRRLKDSDKWEHIDPFVETMWSRYDLSDNIIFLGWDEDFLVKGIDLGNHGHLGPNGSRGSPMNFSKMSRKTIIGHTHTAWIVDGCYSVGTLSQLDMGYNKGPSSWSHTNAIVYANGTRTLVTRRKEGYVPCSITTTSNR